MKNHILFNLLLFVSLSLSAQIKVNQTTQNYIDQYQNIAIKEMEKFGIPASITMAQGILESGSGKSELSISSNNHFGIKCHKSWSGEKVYHDDDAKQECFRKYNTVEESYEDHSLFLKNGQRYAFLFKLSRTDYKGWAHGLKKAGYATNPQYAYRLIDLIEAYDLHKLDKMKSSDLNPTTEQTQEIKDKKAKKDSKKKKTKKQKTEKKKKKKGFFNRKKERDSIAQIKNKIFSENNEFLAEIPAYRTHQIMKINGVKCVTALPGDTYESIAEEFGLFENEVLKANEVQYGAEPKNGDIVFLAKKKKKGNKASYTVKAGETVYIISQKEGVRVRELYKLNNIVYGKQVNEGDIIKLR